MPNKFSDDIGRTLGEIITEPETEAIKLLRGAISKQIGNLVDSDIAKQNIETAMKDQLNEISAEGFSSRQVTVTQDQQDPTIYHIAVQWPYGTLGMLPRLPDSKTDDFLSKYFCVQVEYPDVTAVSMQPGVYQEYVGYTFLNGWINSVTIKKAWLITRYREHSANVVAVERFHRDPPFHLQLHEVFGDDVLILAHEKNCPDHWWVFWFDCDVSDCCIGRFISHEPVDTIYHDFATWAQECSQELSRGYAGNDGLAANACGCVALELDTSKFKGSVSF